jgi:hypothetical protein
MTANEIEHRHLEVFGLIGVAYIMHSTKRWRGFTRSGPEYRKLYGESAERVAFLNETAGFFFRVVQDVLWDDILLHIARLTDPPKQGVYENLTLLRLPSLIDDKAVGRRSAVY